MACSRSLLPTAKSIFSGFCLPRRLFGRMARGYIGREACQLVFRAGFPGNWVDARSTEGKLGYYLLYTLTDPNCILSHHRIWTLLQESIFSVRLRKIINLFLDRLSKPTILPSV